MKISLARTFLLILVVGAILLTLILVDGPGLPEPLKLLRVVLGAGFVLLIPGFALQTALFPHKTDLDPIGRLGFSFGLSLAVLPPIFLILSALGFGVQIWPVAAALGVLVILCATVVYVRLRLLSKEEKSVSTAQLSVKGWWVSQDRISRLLYFLLAAALSTAVVSGIFVSQEAPAEPFTEFYLLDSQGLSMDYPREVTVGTQVIVMLAIVNHEGQPGEYRIVAVGGGNKALSTSEPISLMDGETWQGYLTIVLAQAGDGQKVEFLLERVGSPWPYRTLRIWMNVDPEQKSHPGESGSRLPADESWFPGEEGLTRSMPPVALWVPSAAKRVSW
jgi:uncharacterized membrane protein